MAKVVTQTPPNITLHVHGVSYFLSLHTFWYSICLFFSSVLSKDWDTKTEFDKILNRS